MKKLISTISLIVLMIVVTGCDLSQNLKTPSAKPKIDPNLPVINDTSIMAIPAITKVALEWANTTEANTFGYYIYRSNLQKDGEKLSRVASLNNRYSSHWVDNNLQPQTTYLYTISVKGKDGTESKASNSIKVTTLRVFDSVSYIQASSGLPRQVRIQWRPHDNLAVNRYILQRNNLKDDKWETIKTIKGRLTPEYIDMDLKDKTTYAYRLQAVTFDNIKSNYSKIIQGTTKALPKGVKNVKATKNLPRKIMLTWEPSVQEDIIGYNIYESNSATSTYTKIATAKKDENTFENMINKDNVTKFYKITSVDKDNLETNINTLHPVMGITLSAPIQPTVKLALIKEQKVILNWEKGDDRTVAYNIYRTAQEGYFSTKTKVFKNIQNIRYEDADIVRGVTYTYEIEAVDKNNLVSQKVKMATLKMEKLKEPIKQEEKK